MTQYDLIDPVLSEWGYKNGIKWYSVYQDTDVRVFSLNPDRRDRVNVAVDVPKDGQTTIRIGQNRRGLSRLSRVENITCSVSGLSDALDKALNIAKGWLGPEAG